MSPQELLELAAWASAYTVVVLCAAFQMRINPTSRGTRGIIVLSSLVLLTRGAAFLIEDAHLAQMVYTASRAGAIITAGLFVGMIFMWRADNNPSQ